MEEQNQEHVQEKTQAEEQTQVQEQTQEQIQQSQDSQQTAAEAKPQEQQANNKQYNLQHDRPNCIGCAACEAVAPDFWEMNTDGKSDIKNGKDKDNGWQELEFEEKNFQENKDAADSCPVNVIHIVKKENGEKLI